MTSKRIALVSHPLYAWGGAEYLLKVLSDIFPQAPIYTAWYSPAFVQKYFYKKRFVSSYLQKLPLKKYFPQEMIPLLPKAYKSLNLDAFDLVISISDGFNKILNINKNTKLWLYILSPPRFLWLNDRASDRSLKPTYLIYKYLFEKSLHEKWRTLDREAAQRTDIITSISLEVQRRVKNFYDLQSEVIYPPVDIRNVQFNKDVTSRKEWLLYFGRVETYKGVEIAIKACIKLKQSLMIAGQGSDLKRLKKFVDKSHAGNTIKFLGFVNDDEKWQLYHDCKALLFPVKDEDFGIVPVEANASGAPVIAFYGGGVKETIIYGKTGLFFNSYTAESLIEKIKLLDTLQIDPSYCQNQAKKFSTELFESKVKQIASGSF